MLMVTTCYQHVEHLFVIYIKVKPETHLLVHEKHTMMAGLTLFQKKTLGVGFLFIVFGVLLSNAFITMWIITAIGFNSVRY